MAPKRLTPTSKKRQSPLKQVTLSFKTTKRGVAASSKGKAKTKVKTTYRAKATTESEEENDNETLMVEGSSEDGEGAFVNRQTLDMHDKSGRYTSYFRDVKEMMGGMPPLHVEGQTKVHQMLRVFDNTYDYGPCVGLTRLERWERAEALGLNPPIEVRDILVTEQGSTDEDLVHPIFYGQVL